MPSDHQEVSATSRLTSNPPGDSVTRRRWLVLAVLCISVFLAVVDNTIVNVALPRISEQLHTSSGQLQWIVDAYSLVFASMLLIGGNIGDRFGRKGTLQVGLVTFAAFSAFAGLSGSVHELIVARALMGIAGALIFPATLAIITNVFTDHRERATAVGIWTGIVGLAVALGPLTGGWLLGHFWWGSVFFVSLPIAGLALVAGAFLIPSSRDPSAPRLDLLGFALSIVGVGAIVYTTIEAPGWGWGSINTLGGYALGIVVTLMFVAWERRTREPMLDTTLFKNPRFSAASLSIAVGFFALFGFIFLITQYFQLVRGYDPFSAGVHTLPFAIVTGALSPLAPVAASRYGTKLVVPIGLLLMCAGFVEASTVGVDSAYFGPVIISMVLMASGLAFVSAPSTAAILAALPPAKAGVGSAVNDVSREMGGTFGVAVVGAVFSSVFAPQVVGHLQRLALSRTTLRIAQKSLASALEVAHRVPSHAGVILDAVRASFIDGLSRASLVCAVVAGVGALLAFAVLPRSFAHSSESSSLVPDTAEA